MLQNKALFRKVKVMSNELRFSILELIQKETLSINELSSKLKLSYTKCADYVTLLEQEGLLQKLKDGREVKLISKVAFIGNTIKFEPS
ncbi:MAG TPA: winged helix-turn-helix domain-containing protein [Candidatus Nanoarchaeia archaeon]|nr:winged helix-turn-helix domain-containing protein [Candidatus Nanoarchaeia archaeon]